MLCMKDFMFMDVVNLKGKKIGFIKDLLLDFNKATVIGFMVCPTNLFLKHVNVLVEDIIYFNENMIIREINKNKCLQFSTFKGMDVIDQYGNALGTVEEIIFCSNTFKLKGIIVSTGFINSILGGKRILLIKELILGEENILYIPKEDKYKFINVPRKLFMEVDNYENIKE